MLKLVSNQIGIAEIRSNLSYCDEDFFQDHYLLFSTERNFLAARYLCYVSLYLKLPVCDLSAVLDEINTYHSTNYHL